MQISKIKIYNYRSIAGVELEPPVGQPLIITGANNIGKTNFLRALDLFFSMDPDKFDPAVDIPFHIYFGSGGSGNKTEVTVDFLDSATSDVFSIKTKYFKKEEQPALEVSGVKFVGGQPWLAVDLTRPEIDSVVGQFRYILVESNNVDLPSVIASFFEDDVLTGLDKLKKRQKTPLKHLEDFFNTSRTAVSGIEKDVSAHFQAFVSDVEGLNNKDWKVRVIFPEFETLREVVARLVSYTVSDSNDNEIETKGSGIQRIMLLALIRYMDSKTKKKIIWAIDEPEVFLQPSLQKRVAKELRQLAAKSNIFLTTHSQHLIDVGNIEHTHLFVADTTPKQYKRSGNKLFIAIDTHLSKAKGVAKLEEIKRHIGLGRNDSWEIMPFNLMVEGEDDKNYLQAFADQFDLEMPNTLFSGGADKLAAYVQFLQEFCADAALGFKPKVRCILDNDEKGRQVFGQLDAAIKKNRFQNIDLEIILAERWDGTTNKSVDSEVEDLVYPELMVGAANKILSLKKYHSISAALIKKRAQKAYQGVNFLSYLTSMAMESNPTKSRLDFEELGLKVYLSKMACPMIRSDQMVTALDKKYPTVRAFVSKILTP